MQTWSQLMTLNILVLMTCYTDFVPGAEIRYQLGYAQMVILFVLVAPTLFTMVFNIWKTAQLRLKRLKNRGCRHSCFKNKKQLPK